MEQLSPLDLDDILRPGAGRDRVREVEWSGYCPQVGLRRSLREKRSPFSWDPRWPPFSLTGAPSDGRFDHSRSLPLSSLHRSVTGSGVGVG